MKRLNPETGKAFKYGDTRSDGKVFRTYISKRKKDGFFVEVWHSKEVFVKQHDAQKSLATKWRKIRASERSELIDKIKTNAGCAVCGYKDHPAALDFDHIDPATKKFDISKRFAMSSKKLLMEEIKKCRVLCANCHRIHSRENGHSFPKTGFNKSNRIDEIVAKWYQEKAIKETGE